MRPFQIAAAAAAALAALFFLIHAILLFSGMDDGNDYETIYGLNGLAWVFLSSSLGLFFLDRAGHAGEPGPAAARRPGAGKGGY